MEVRYIEWIDSSGSNGGWQSLDDWMEHGPHRCRTVGFLLRESADEVVIVQSIDDEHDGQGQGNNFVAIPKFAITKSKTLKRA